MIIECMPDLTDGMAQRFLATVIGAPDLGQQVLTRDHVARGLREAQQCLHRFGADVCGACPTGYLPFERFDEQRPEIEVM